MVRHQLNAAVLSAALRHIRSSAFVNSRFDCRDGSWEGRPGILDVHEGMDLHHRRQVDSADDSVARGVCAPDAAYRVPPASRTMILVWLKER